MTKYLKNLVLISSKLFSVAAVVVTTTPSAHAARTAAKFSTLNQTKWQLVARRCEDAQFKVAGLDNDWTNILSFSNKTFVSTIVRTSTEGDTLLPLGYTERISGVFSIQNAVVRFEPLVRRTLLNSATQQQDFGQETARTSQVFPTAWALKVLVDNDGEWMYGYEPAVEGKCTKVMQVFKRVYN